MLAERMHLRKSLAATVTHKRFEVVVQLLVPLAVLLPRKAYATYYPHAMELQLVMRADMP